MAGTDRDLAGRLPDAPPPRPDRREATIDAALRRFDGEAPAADRPRTAPQRSRASYRPQIGAVAAAALAVTIGLPIWLSGRVPAPQVEPASQVGARSPAARPTEAAAPPPAGARLAAPVAAPPARTDAPRTASAPAPDAPPQQAPVPPPPAPPPPAPPPPPPPQALAPARFAAEPAAEAIVVTGSRIAPAAAPAPAPVAERRSGARGDWNRCTVDDPSRDLSRCRTTFGSGTSGIDGRAQALVGDGVMRAWQGDRTGAMAILDRAVAVEPTADALVNRALLRADAGDDAGALADLDRAVRRDPGAARGYHHRGIVLARRGRTARAEADARRAAALDPGYAAAPR